MNKIMSLLACICIVWVFVELQPLVDGPEMSFVGGIICPQALQTCWDNSLQSCSIRQTRTKLLSLSFLTKPRKVNFSKLPTGPLAYQKTFKTFKSLETMWIKNWKLFVEKNCEKNMKNMMTIQSTIKIINWPYKFMADRLSILWP